MARRTHWAALGSIVLLLAGAQGPSGSAAAAAGASQADTAAALEAAAAGSEVVVPLEALERTAPAAPAPAVATVPRPALPEPTGGAIERAWFGGGDEIGERVWRTRRAAYELGVWNLDGAARSLLATEGLALESAEAAVNLAPDLPAAHIEWARARWLAGESPLSAVRAVAGALLAFARHPEGALWLGGSLLALLAFGLVIGGCVSIAVTSLFVLPHAAHDFGDAVSRKMPAFGRAALLGTLLLIPVALGEGLFGFAAALVAVCAIYGRPRQRFALVVAVLAIVAGAYPVAELAGRALGALAGDPIARAALATSRGVVTPADAARLASAPADDELAQEGLARLARREGNLGRADALYQKLIQRRPEDPVLLANAANVRLHLGHMESAFELYRRSLDVNDSALVLFNVSQAYGRAFQVENLTQALELAQAQDGDLVAELTRLQGTQPEGFVVDLPLATRDLLLRVLRAADGTRWAAEFRAPFAPGRMGASPAAGAAPLLIALLLGAAVGTRMKASVWCGRCGGRVCPRCEEGEVRGDICGPCNKLFNHPELTDRELRVERIDALRDRGARIEKLASGVSIALPGAAGVLGRRPLLGLWGAIFSVIAIGAVVGREGAVPDPLVAGDAGPLAFFCVAALSLIAYAFCVGKSMAARRRF